MATGYTREYSKYIQRDNNTPTKYGFIKESDKLTTSQKYTIVNGNIVTTTDGGFSFVVNTTPDESKSYNVDGWDIHTGFTLGNLDITVNDFETSQTVSNSYTSVKKQKYATLDKSYSDLSKFCYFGSLNAMLNASVSNIINTFPAALYIVTNENIKYSGKNITVPIDDVENKFNIDLFNYYPEERVNLTYNLRTFSTSYSDYEIVNDNNEFVGNIVNFTGYTTGNTTGVTFELSEILSVTGNTYLIRPKEEKRNNFFSSLDDFERTLLNIKSVPKYRAYFKVPTETSNGVEFEYKSFTWPVLDGYNIDIESSSYVSYMSELVDLTNFIDEIYCDNIYRMLTHDTIKNLDSTYEREIDEERLDEIVVGGTKIQKVLRLYGRSYDEIKKYIEGISFANTVTYDKIDNLPIEYFDSNLNTSGWDVFSLTSSIDKNTTTSSGIFDGISGQYTLEDTNNELIRRMAINSNYIFRSKGTKKAIRKMFGLLGFENDWFEIREYTQLVDNLIENPSYLEKIANLNYYVYPEMYSVSDGKEEFEYTSDQSLFDNTNIGIYVRCPICGSEDYIVSGDTYGEYNTAICTYDHEPFDITGNTIGYPKPLKNSTDYYFQQKGNWFRETGGVHTNFSGTTNYVNEISYGNNPHIGYLNADSTGYDNGYDYISQFNDLFKRFIRNVGESSTVDMSGYTKENYNGFTTNTKKTIDNTKIAYKETPYDNCLTLNLKNFVIGINGDKVLQSFFNENNEIENKITNTSGTTTYDVTGFNNDFVQILTLSGQTILKVHSDAQNKRMKIHNSILGNNSEITLIDENDQLISGITIKPGKTILMQTIIGETIKEYIGEDEFELLKSISLSYIEQLIPSTAIFDFVLIDINTPKWKLVDDYPEKGDDGFYTGNRILVYQNVNYFDTESSGVNDDLTGNTGEIISNFGTGFTFIDHIVKSTIMKSENNENSLIFEDGDYALTETGELSSNGNPIGFDNMYLFRGKYDKYSKNIDPIWVNTKIV